MVQDTPSRKLDQYIVRFPDGMRDRLKDAAAANKRSLNAEIIARLEASLFDTAPGLGGANRPKRNDPPLAALDRRILELSKKIDALSKKHQR
ncbi:Arc family DNA-binding protein [Nitrobacter sp. TKz-YC02]|uniref:Arc family DNA-binding protein n=1 Tax=Nitrobacter sp. TKz-YC02 TaxID=3398704 RepID=UPI003CF66F5D